MKDLIKKIIHLLIIKKSYSQNKEDLFLIEFFKDLKKGFYLDLGCHHPKRFSNTYLLYKRGWSGINVDANYSTILLFNLFRKRDKNIRALINTNSVSVFYYKFNDSALNGILSPQNAKRLVDVGYKLKKKVKMNSISINDFIKKYGLVNKKINFLKIDLEGIDFELIKVLDFNIIDIQVIMIEKKQNKIKEDEMKLYLKNKFYKLIFESNRNFIFSSFNKS